MKVLLYYSRAAREVMRVELSVPEGTTVDEVWQRPEAVPVRDAVEQMRVQGIEAEVVFGVWNAKADGSTVLQDGDRLEVYRPLLVDPKVARRERFSKQGGAKTAGLFNKRRPGAKAGY